MAFLAKARKEDLQILATEMGAEVTSELKIIHLKKLIVENENYEEEFVKDLLATIVKTRVEKEERELKARVEREEREERELKARVEREERELKARAEREEREFELQKLRIESEIRAQDSSSEHSAVASVSRPRLELHHLMPKFDPKDNDISLYLVLFERQVRRMQVQRELWVSHLLGLLPCDIAQLIARESEEEADNYDHVKGILLKRYKLTPEKFRQMFMNHYKSSDGTWTDFVYELKNYFREWVEGLEVKTFSQLSDLIITEQLKRRVPQEVREHFLDEWTYLKSPDELAKKLEEYDSVRSNRKKGFSGAAKEKSHPSWKAKSASEEKFPPKEQRVDRNELFEKRRKLRCFECQSTDHLRPQCPRLKKPETPAIVNRIIERAEEELLSDYISMGEVNGVPMPILRDSGSTIDIVGRGLITPEMLTGEQIWIQQPLDEEPICLPLAEVEIKGDFGHVITKAAVVSNQVDRGRYLLGNRTAALLNKMRNDKPESTTKGTSLKNLFSEKGYSGVGKRQINTTPLAIKPSRLIKDNFIDESSRDSVLLDDDDSSKSEHKEFLKTLEIDSVDQSSAVSFPVSDNSDVGDFKIPLHTNMTKIVEESKPSLLPAKSSNSDDEMMDQGTSDSLNSDEDKESCILSVINSDSDNSELLSQSLLRGPSKGDGGTNSVGTECTVKQAYHQIDSADNDPSATHSRLTRQGVKDDPNKIQMEQQIHLDCKDHEPSDNSDTEKKISVIEETKSCLSSLVDSNNDEDEPSSLSLFPDLIRSNVRTAEGTKRPSMTRDAVKQVPNEMCSENEDSADAHSRLNLCDDELISQSKLETLFNSHVNVSETLNDKVDDSVAINSDDEKVKDCEILKQGLLVKTGPDLTSPLRMPFDLQDAPYDRGKSISGTYGMLQQV